MGVCLDSVLCWERVRVRVWGLNPNLNWGLGFEFGFGVGVGFGFEVGFGFGFGFGVEFVTGFVCGCGFERCGVCGEAAGTNTSKDVCSEEAGGEMSSSWVNVADG